MIMRDLRICWPILGHSRIYLLISRLRAHPGPGRISRPTCQTQSRGRGGEAAALGRERRRRGVRARGRPKWSRKRLRQAASGQCPRARRAPMISNDVGEGGLRGDARDRAQLPAILAPPVADATAGGRNTLHHRRRGSRRAAGKLDAAGPLERGNGLLAVGQVLQRLPALAGSVVVSPAD